MPHVCRPAERRCRRGRIGSTKHDGYRLTVHREGKRVRLFTRNGHDWTDRYLLIVEAALRIRIGSFVLDREAVLLGVDGRSDFDGLHSRQHNDAMLGTSASTALHVGSRSSFVS